MAYNALNNLIDAYIYANGVQAITGQILNGVLKQMVSQLGSGYHLMGVAGPETEPASNDYAMAYFAATAGEYTDFGGITLAAGEVAVLLTSGNGSWSKQTIYNIPTGTADLENTAEFITNAVTDLVNYYTKTEIDTTLADYPTLEDLATALAEYYTKTEIDTILADYTTNTALASALADYYNKNDIDGLLSVVNAALADRYTKSETDTALADYYKKTETYDKDEVDSIVATLSRQEYIVAWDGSSAPDVTAIPAGVTVTYSGTTYTGTLAASASTVNKIYMVWNGTAYDMYGTSQDGGYSWVPMGTTTVDLSQYATKAEVSQLEAKVDLKIDGEAIVDKGLVWSNGYVNGTTGVVTASSTSQFSQPVLLKAGEKISYKTGATYSKAVVEVPNNSPVSVGDTLSGNTIINYASANSVVEYIATSDIYIVITVQIATNEVFFTVYDDDSVKNQIEDLDFKIADVNLNIGEDFKVTDFVSGVGIDTSGNEVSNSYRSATTYIPVKNGDKISWNGLQSSGTFLTISFYTSGKSFISGNSLAQGANYAVPSTAAFVRACGFSPLGAGYISISRYSEVANQFRKITFSNLLGDNVTESGKVINSSTGAIFSGTDDYKLCKFEVTNGGKYYITTQGTGHGSLAKYTDDTYTTASEVILKENTDYVGELTLSAGYYAMSWLTTRGTYQNSVSRDASIFSQYIQALVQPEPSKIPSVQNLFTEQDILSYTRITNTGAFETTGSNYKTYKFNVSKAGWYFIQSGQNSYSNPELCKYTDGTYGTLSAKIIDDNSAGVPARITGLYYLEVGYYALCHGPAFTDSVVITEYAGVVSYLDEGAKAIFNTIDSNYPGVIVRGTSARTTGGINLKSGYSNRVSLDAGFVCAHYTMAFRFVSTNDVALVVGYSIDNYATLSNHFKVVGGTTNKFYYYSSANDSTPEEHAIGFSVNSDEEYLFVLTWNNDNGKFKLELFGQFNEYASWELDGNPGSIPMFYSETDDTLVESFQLSPQCYYDLNNAKLGVFGHSFVQASTMRGSGLQYSFVGLLASALGEDKVLNFGLGGENYYNALSKLNNELLFVKNTEYALAYLGVNDVFGGITGAQLIQRAENFVARFKKQYNIVPILFTCQPSVPGNTLAGAYSGVQQAALDYNAWLRSSGYLYVDAEQAFVDINVKTTTPTNSNIKTGLFLADGVHPNADGHRAIFNRIKMDCPFLF